MLLKELEEMLFEKNSSLLEERTVHEVYDMGDVVQLIRAGILLLGYLQKGGHQGPNVEINHFLQFH